MPGNEHKRSDQAVPTTRENSARPARRDAFSPRPILIAICILFLARVVPELLVQWYNSDGKFILDTDVYDILTQVLLEWVLYIAIGLVLLYLIILKWRKGLSHSAAVILLGAAFLYPKPILLAMQHAKLFLVPTVYESCARTSRQYAETARFKVCNIREDGPAFSMIIYDSGGQINLDSEHQSEDFKKFLTLNENSELFRGCNVFSTRLRGDFYYVQPVC
jgi:hypothetical protein